MATTTLEPRCGPAGYVPLSPDMLRRLTSTEVRLYLWDSQSSRAVLYCEAETPLDAATVEAVIASRNEVYIRAGEFRQACPDLSAVLEQLVADESLTASDRFRVMQMAVSEEIDRTFKARDPGLYVLLATDVAGQIAKLVSENELLPAELLAIARHDALTFAHVTNVAGYATMLARQIGIADADELDEIAVGAMLHDIGKRSIPTAILGKPGRLSDDEREFVKMHPQRGYEQLLGRDDVSDAQRLMVYQHHEHFDGTGYPVRIRGDEIHPWARLLAVVDVFDALTGTRRYRNPMPMVEAADYITARAGTQFDEEMATCWVSMILSS